jgi:hypothetical protein
MRKAAIITLTVMAFLFVGSLRASAQPSKESLIQAWEKIQKSDPETVVFEKIADNSYKFKTNRFPFDGELRILNVAIDDRLAGSEFGIKMGIIEHELVGLSDEDIKKYEHSYSIWKANNTLYYDSDTNAWQSLRENQAKMIAKARNEYGDEEFLGGASRRRNTWAESLITWLPVLFIIGMWIWLIKKMGLMNNREYMDRATLHMNRVEETLERIAKSVEKNTERKE